MKNQVNRTIDFMRKSLIFNSTGLCLFVAVLANNAKAQDQFFGPNGGVTTGGSYSWDDPNWTPNLTTGAAAGNVAPYTSSWVPGNFARFYNGAGDTYTVTVNAAESMSGMYLDASATLNINDAGNNTGSLSLTPDTAQATQNGFSWLTQGVLTTGTLNINAPIGGTGGVEEESGGGTLGLYGVNTYTGGTLVTSSSTFIGYNNNASFGAATSQIGYDGTTFAIMENTGPSTVNIPNNVQTIGGTGVNFIGNSATMSGNWYFGGGSSAINIRNNGVGTTETLSGVLSGTTGAVTFSSANGGKIVLGGANTYTGPTVVGSSGDANVTLQMGTPNALGSSSTLTMAGGTFSAGGYNQAMGGTLGMTVSSTLDFGAPANTAISFTGGTASWTASTTLNLADWAGNSVADGGTSSDTLEFGTGPSGLTSAELGDIEFDGNAASKGLAALDSQGYLMEVPEPSAIALWVMGGVGAMFTLRRRTA